MLKQVLRKPDYLFEVSWEVCNKVGGIYTVLATKAHYIKTDFKDNYILIGPDFWKDKENREFIEDTELFKTWKHYAAAEGLKVRTGRWNIAGNPAVILVDFGGAYYHQNEIFQNLWDNFQVDSITGQFDYIEPALFGFYCGIVIESFCKYYVKNKQTVIAHFHEWMTGAGIFHLKQKAPHIATVFTTHATVLGRCVAGGGWPFYSRFYQHEPEYAAWYFNVAAKHTLEKACAHHADCFTTVSDITAKECRHFLYKDPHLITNNGMDSGKVPKRPKFQQKREAARKIMLEVASALCDETIAPESLFVLITGRYEFKNKGIDVFIDALGCLNDCSDLNKNIVAFICVPANHSGPRKELQEVLAGGEGYHQAAGVLTHGLWEEGADLIINNLNKRGLNNNSSNKVKVVYVPTFLNGHDGVFNLNYYDMLIGFDLTVFPSYYEPWGYTPLESLSYQVPSITTSISGLGLAVKNLPYNEQNGISIIDRNDYNEEEITNTIKLVIDEYVNKTNAEIKDVRNKAKKLSRFFLWESQLHHYKEAYHIALKSKIARG